MWNRGSDTGEDKEQEQNRRPRLQEEQGINKNESSRYRLVVWEHDLNLLP
jgi:hypothetical protein